MLRKPEQILENNGYDVEALSEEGTVLFREPDYASAICGITHDNQIVYNFEKMVEHLVENSFVEDYDEAVDFILYNASFGMSGYKMPIIMYPLLQENQ